MEGYKKIAWGLVSLWIFIGAMYLIFINSSCRVIATYSLGWCWSIAVYTNLSILVALICLTLPLVFWGRKVILAWSWFMAASLFPGSLVIYWTLPSSPQGLVFPFFILMLIGYVALGYLTMLVMWWRGKNRDIAKR